MSVSVRVCAEERVSFNRRRFVWAMRRWRRSDEERVAIPLTVCRTLLDRPILRSGRDWDEARGHQASQKVSVIAELGLPNMTQPIVEDGEGREDVNDAKVRTNAAVANRVPCFDTVRQGEGRGGGGGEERMQANGGVVSLVEERPTHLKVEGVVWPEKERDGWIRQERGRGGEEDLLG